MKFPHRSARRFAPRKTGDASPLGQLESAVMEVVWSRTEPTTVSDVHSALPPEEPVAYNTVKTTMERLAEKGILTPRFRAPGICSFVKAPAAPLQDLPHDV